MRCHHFGDDTQPGLLFSGIEHLQRAFAVALETIGAGARFECAAADKRRTRVFHQSRDSDNLFGALHGTRAGDDRELSPTKLRAVDSDDSGFLPKLAARQFKRSGDRHRPFNTGH